MNTTPLFFGEGYRGLPRGFVFALMKRYSASLWALFNAEITQLVEYLPSKQDVAGSSPVLRSIFIDLGDFSSEYH